MGTCIIDMVQFLGLAASKQSADIYVCIYLFFTSIISTNVILLKWHKTPPYFSSLIVAVVLHSEK